MSERRKERGVQYHGEGGKHNHKTTTSDHKETIGAFIVIIVADTPGLEEGDMVDGPQPPSHMSSCCEKYHEDDECTSSTTGSYFHKLS